MRGGIDLFTHAAKVDLAVFGGHFATFKSAIRLESLPQYHVSNELPALAEFRAGRIPDTSFNAEWHEILTAAKTRGAQVSRMRAVPSTPTDYLKFEIQHAYRQNALLGEDISFCLLSDLATVVGEEGAFADFWVFDETTTFLMVYDGRGGFMGVVQAANDVSGDCLAVVQRLRLVSRPLDWAVHEYAAARN